MPVVHVIAGYEAVMWKGKLSEVNHTGPIVAFVKDVLAEYSTKIVLICAHVDGILQTPLQGEANIYIHLDSELDELFPSTDPKLYLTLCTRNVNRRNLICLPLDDECFTMGVTQKLLTEVIRPMWCDRKPIAFWRGVGSDESVRMQVVERLIGVPNTDVRLTKTRIADGAHMIDPIRYSPRVSIQEHLRYKYILIIDGVCIASAHQWVFASGSVPILITHPDNKFWFKPYLKPMVNYVPVKYDLTDLIEKIQWLVQHDDDARRIAENAVHFANTIFSSEFQHDHVRSEIRHALA